ncbi:MAG: hypothetical protein R3E97_14425 [Candidatus Eisenbacteria bacterium]
MTRVLARNTTRTSRADTPCTAPRKARASTLRPAGRTSRAFVVAFIARPAFALVRAFALAGAIASTASALDAVGTRLPLEFRSWRIEDPDGSVETVSQLHVPLTVSVELEKHSRLVVETAGGRSLSSPTGEDDRSLGGLADARLQLYQDLPAASLLLFAGVELPAGVGALDPAELAVTRRIANPVLGMRQREYGGGLDWNVGAVWSTPLSEQTRLSFGLAGRLAGAYAVSESEADLEPGAQATATVDLSWRNQSWERRRRDIGGSVSYRIFSSDEQAGTVVFEEGAELHFETRATLPIGGSSWFTRASFVLKEENVSYGGAAGALAPRELAAGTGLWVDTAWRFPIGDSVRLGPDVRARTFDGNDLSAGEGDGWALEFGPSLDLGLGESSALQFRGAYALGSLGRDDRAADLTGFVLGVGANFRLR